MIDPAVLSELEAKVKDQKGFSRDNIRQTLDAAKLQVGRNVKEDLLVTIIGTATETEFELIIAILKGLLDAGRTEEEQRAIASLVRLLYIRIGVWQSHLAKLKDSQQIIAQLNK